jgi:intracellular septation protein
MKDKQHSWVKHLVDWGPLVAFFVAFKVGGIMQATIVLIVVTVVLTSLGYVLTRKVQPMPLVTLVIVCIFGGLTIWLQDETFIKMKPTIILTLFAAILIGGLMIGKPPLKFLMGSALELDDAGWRKLTLRFALFFLVTASLNEIIWRTQSTDLWVNFKVFGILGLNLVFMVTQIPLIMRHQIKQPTE